MKNSIPLGFIRIFILLICLTGSYYKDPLRRQAVVNKK